MATSTVSRLQVETGAAQARRYWRLQAPVGARDLSRSECLRRLALQQEGRLHHRTGVGPRALMVRYQRYSDGVWIAVPGIAAVGHRPRQQVALDVSGRTDGELWGVVVAGEVRAIGRAKPLRAPMRGPAPQPELRHLFLPATVVFGFTC